MSATHLGTPADPFADAKQAAALLLEAAADVAAVEPRADDDLPAMRAGETLAEARHRRRIARKRYVARALAKRSYLILSLRAQGYAQEDIADRLGISAHAVARREHAALARFPRQAADVVGQLHLARLEALYARAALLAFDDSTPALARIRAIKECRGIIADSASYYQGLIWRPQGTPEEGASAPQSRDSLSVANLLEAERANPGTLERLDNLIRRAAELGVTDVAAGALGTRYLEGAAGTSAGSAGRPAPRGVAPGVVTDGAIGDASADSAADTTAGLEAEADDSDAKTGG